MTCLEELRKARMNRNRKLKKAGLNTDAELLHFWSLDRAEKVEHNNLKMSADTDIEREICDFLKLNGKSKALTISNKFGLDKRTVNKHLYDLERSNEVFKTNDQPPVWDLMKNKPGIKQTLKPEIKSTTTRDTSEEKDVEDLLRSGGLKAHHIAEELGQTTQTIKRQLYSMEEKGKVQKCRKSNMWTLNEERSDDSFSRESSCPSDHKLDSVSGLSHSFEVIAVLGEGGYGCVYKVKHRYDGKIYAVKRVILTPKADSEVKALARLDHPNIVRYITCWPASDSWTSDQDRNQVSNTSSDVVTFDRDGCEEKDDDDDDEDDYTSGMESLSVTESASAAEPSGNNRNDSLDPSNHSETYLFIQMDFCKGGTLTDWIKERNFMEKQRIIVEIHHIFYEIITGVEYIHTKKLIHRDLKPDNILFGADGKVKIGDFGLVAAQSDQNGDPIERSNRGTTSYMSPEQKNKKNYDEKTDIFPLGLVWFEMIWKISTGSERMKLWPDLRERRFPEGFSDSYRTESKFITKMLSYSPEHRPHAKDIKERLEKFFSLDQNLSQKTV